YTLEAPRPVSRIDFSEDDQYILFQYFEGTQSDGSCYLDIRRSDDLTRYALLEAPFANLAIIQGDFAWFYKINAEGPALNACRLFQWREKREIDLKGKLKEASLQS